MYPESLEVDDFFMAAKIIKILILCNIYCIKTLGRGKNKFEMKVFFTFFLAILTILFCTSCNKKDLTPAYICVTPEDFENSIDVSNYNETHGMNFDQEQLLALTKHEFTHVNVFVNNKNLGCWELPCKVPVLDVDNTDSCTLILVPCFRLSGMGNTISGYPFFNILRQRVLLQKGKEYHASQNPPKYVYSEYTHIPFFETFYNSSSFRPTDTISHTLTFQSVFFDGNNVGEIVLNDVNGLNFDVVSSKITVPIGNYRTLLEIRYCTESSIDVGLKMSTGINPHQVHSVAGFYASPNEWKTIHFDLTQVINTNHNMGSVTDLSLVLSGVGEKGKDTHFYIDDIKVMYIKTM